MIQIKKTILTLVALLAVTTGAWADETPLLTIESKDYPSFKSGSMTFDDMVTVTFSKSVYNTGNNNGWFTGSTASLLTVAGINGYTITSCKFYTENGDAANGYTVEGDSPSVYLYNTNVYTDASQLVDIGYSGVTKIEVYGTAPSASSATAVDIAWDAASKTGSFDMPGGNVELEPEYYPQAELTAKPTAINDVPATTDGAIVNAGTVANIGETTNAQGTVMYYVSPTALDDADLLALAADAWTADVPTAQSFKAAGTAHVYYYVRGNDSDTDDENFSDGDILSANALTVTIAAAPTYAVTFAEGTDPNEWTASPNADVTKGETVTVTYSGTKKVLGVKAEKKAAAPATVLSGALVDGAIIKVNFKWRGDNDGDYVQGVYNAASGTFTVSKGGGNWATDDRAVYKVEKSGDNIIIGACFYDYGYEGMVWTFNTTNDTYTTTNGIYVNEEPGEYGLISVTLNGTDITSQLTAQ